MHVVSLWIAQLRIALALCRFLSPGEFVFVLDLCVVRFRVLHQVLQLLVQAAFNSFYFRLSGVSIVHPFGGMWIGPSADNGPCVFVHAIGSSFSRAVVIFISSAGCWCVVFYFYMCVVFSVYFIGLILGVCRMFLFCLACFFLCFPEISHLVPGFLDEMFFNLFWLLSMLERLVGCVYPSLSIPFL